MEIGIDNIKSHFSDLSFEEDKHKYYVGGVPIDKSVSALIGRFYEKFNTDLMAPFSARKRGITVEEIKKEWGETNEESTTRGHRVHAFGELYQFDRNLTPSCPQERGIVKFWTEKPEHIISVGAELRMYHKELFYAGTMDILLFDTKTQSYIIADYKTNKDLHKNYKGKTMLAPFSRLLDSPLNHYQIQLSYYQILLEQIGIKVSRRIIIWLDMEGNYQMIDTEDLTDILKSTV